MRKRYGILLFAILWAVMLAACGNKTESSTTEKNTQNIESDKGNTEETSAETQQNISKESTINPTEENADDSESKGDVQMQKMIIEVGGQQFQADLYDNETTRALKDRLPMTISMDELHGNEKFYYLEEGLPANAENVGSIQTGDIMLFGSDCLVLFFEDFDTSYSYTRIGHIEDEEGFANALTDGTVEVTFEAGE